MTLVFEKEVYFDPTTDDAIIWGNDDSTRFRLVIRRSLLSEKPAATDSQQDFFGNRRA